MNMMKTVLIASAMTLSGCATVMSQPTPGLLYSDTTYGNALSSNQAGTRVGESCSQSILGLVATGDASIESARRNGGITMLTSVDQKAYSILGVYAKYCTVVRGR